MPRYKITLELTTFTVFEVEAENEDQALEFHYEGKSVENSEEYYENSTQEEVSLI